MSTSEAKMPLTFHIYRGGRKIRSETLTQHIIKIGKLPSSHLRVDDPQVSRMHAVIEVTRPDEVAIIDLGSSSGTTVNGQKINRSKLRSGDEIEFGETKIVVEFGDESVVSEPGPGPVSGPPAPPSRGAGATLGAERISKGSQDKGLSMGAFDDQGGGRGYSEPPELDDDELFSSSLEGATEVRPGPVSAPPAFLRQSQEFEDPEQVQYGIVASGPPVSPEEVETADPAIEVMLMWGDRSVLHVQHMSPPADFYVGEGEEKEKKGSPSVQYIIGREVLGVERMPVVLASGSTPNVVIPAGATVEVISGQQVWNLDALQRSGQLQPCPELPGAMMYPLSSGMSAKVRFRGLVFLVKPVHAGKRVAIGANIDRRPLVYVAGSLLAHLVFLLMFYFLPPRPASLSLDLLNADSRLVKYLMEPTELEEEKPEMMPNNASDQSGGKGQRHKDDEGAMGKEDSKKTNNRFGIKGPQDNPDPHMAREKAKEQAANAGILGVLRATSGAWDSPTSPYGRDTALGNDPMSALGALMGSQIGENFGFGGLGLRGTGRGGGGTGEGTIGLGNLGTIGHGAGGGDGSGYGRGAGGLKGRSSKVPQIRSGVADVRGSLSKEVIRRVVQRHINEVKFCYEQELNSRPDLQGRVTVSFIIAPTGAVQSATVADSSLGNRGVETCIAGAVRRWTFPSPEGGGVVVVSYPFMLQAPGG